MKNLNSILSLALKPGNDYLRAVLMRLIIFTVVAFLSSILIIIGLGFLVWSSFLYLGTVFSPYVAALLSGLIAIVLAGVVAIVVISLTGSAGKKEKKVSSGATQFDGANEVINEYPLESGLMAMAAGFIAGSSPDSRKALTELFVTLSQNSSD